MSISAFRANIEDITGNAAIGARAGAEIDPQCLHSQEMNERAAAKEQAELLGLPGGSVVSVSGRATAENAQIKTAKQNAERQGMANRAATDVALWVALMVQGDLDGFVAESVFGAKTDEEISEIVADIEAETGQSFEDYASDLLGEDMPDREPGENDTDYQRRVLIAIGDKVLNEDLTIKPGYEDNPVARIIRQSEVYQEAREGVADIQNARENGSSIEQVESMIDEVTQSALMADFSAAALDGDTEVVNEVRASHALGSNGNLEQDQKVNSTSDFLSTLG